ncbi:MAG: aldehyde dehydrogenase family protein [Pseudomonadota bacterium]
MSELESRFRKHLPARSRAIVGGEPCGGGELLPVAHPDTGQPLLELQEARAEDVEQAVGVARAAFENGAWSRAPIATRQQVLHNAADLIEGRADELAGVDSLTTGLLYHRSTRRQTMSAAGWFRYYAELIGTTSESLYRQLPDTHTLVTREPVGVAGLFTPWNIPVMGAALKLAGALAMGNSCVLKPSELSPLGAERLVRLLHEAGVPEDVLNLVNGRGTVTGAALAGHPDVALVSFTGGERAGAAIASQAASRFAKTTMELGGKSANIIFSDADLDSALDGALAAIYSNNGEACLAGSRILVHRTVADRFISDFVARATKLRLGGCFDAAAELGPQVSSQQLERVLSFADRLQEEGGELLAGGRRAEGVDDKLAGGFFVEPTVAVAPNNSLSVCQEEIFGPFATFLTFDDDNQAVEIANDTRFGLAAYLWTNNLQRALKVSQALRSGTVLINTPMQRERNAPFGGFGHSGVDREGGRWSLDFYSEAKTTVIPYGGTTIPKLGST